MTAEQQGRQRLYRIEPSGVARLQAEIATFWTRELDELVRDADRLADARAYRHPTRGETMNHRDQRPVFTASVDLPVGPDEAFALVTEPERLRRWTAVCATVDLRAGGSWSWLRHPGPDVACGRRGPRGRAGRRLVLGWGWEGDEALPPDASTVTVTIERAQTRAAA